MKNYFVERLNFCIRLYFGFFLLGAANVAHAQISTQFVITPPVAGPGVPRQVTVTLPMLTGCEPTGATVVPGDPRERAVTIRFDGSVEGRLCTTPVYLYSKTVNITADTEGDTKMILISNDGRYAGDSVMHTRAPASSRSLYDISGMWFDPATMGSGLTFVHAAAGSDDVFGTWYVYDSGTAPRWYSMQSVQWSNGGMVADGQIYETHANAAPCTFPVVGCPVIFSTIQPVARMHLVMQGVNSARVQAISPAGVVLFSSDIVRSVF